jgi:hypothetical protein
MAMKKLLIFGALLTLTALSPLAAQYSTIFNQTVDTNGIGYTSAYDPPNAVQWRVADNFNGLNDPVTKVTFYGAAGFHDGSNWIPGAPAAIEPFNVNFYAYQQEWTQPPVLDPGVMAPSTGTYTVNLYDSYGDGWNGGSLDVYVDGVQVLFGVTLPSGGGPGSWTFPANAGEYILTVYMEGSWGYENWYQILDPLNNVIAQDGDDTQTAAPTGIGVLPVPPLYAPSTGTYTVNLYDSYGDGWNGGLLDVYVNGVQVLSDLTIASGAGPEAHTFFANLGEEIVTIYTAGSWAYENWYEILDPSSNQIAQDGDASQTAPPTGIGFLSTLVTLEPDWANPLYVFNGLPVLTSYVGPAWGGWEIYKYEAYLPTPVPMADGWVSPQIQSHLGSGQWYLWWTSLDGDGISFQTTGYKGDSPLGMAMPPNGRDPGLKGGVKDQHAEDMAFELATGVPEEIVVSEYGNTPLPPGVVVTPGGTMPPELPGPDSGAPAVLYTIEAVGTWDVVVFRPVAWTVDWYCWIKVGTNLIAGPNPIPAAQLYHVFTGVNFDVKGEATVVVNDNQTLPVELSSFTAVLTAEMFVNIAWVSESETNHMGYNLLRGESDSVEDALQVNGSIITSADGVHNGSQVSYNYLDTEVMPGTTYWYWLESLDLGGATQLHGPVSVLVNGDPDDPGIPPLPPTVTRLLPAYPNPFNPSTNIRYALKEASKVKIEIYNARGQLMRVYDNAYGDPGYYQIMWDGKDANGNKAASGVYLYRMTAGHYTSSRKMVLAK